MPDQPEPHQELREAADEAVQALGDWRGAPPVVRHSAQRLENTAKLRDAAEMAVDSLQNWSSAPPQVRESISDLEQALDHTDPTP